MEQQLSSITIERDKLWKIVEALLAPAVAERSVSPRAAPGALSPPAGGGSFALSSLSLDGGPPSPPRSKPALPPFLSPAGGGKEETHVIDLLFSLLQGADGKVSSADLKRLGKTAPPGSPRSGGGGGGGGEEERRFDFDDFQRLLAGAGRRKGEATKFSLVRRMGGRAGGAAASEENIEPRASGVFPSREWRVDFFFEGVQMSPWHDVRLQAPFTLAPARKRAP